MKHAIEIDSGAMIHVQSFINIASGIQNLLGGGGDPTQTAR
jgi:hypothetical protein